MKPVAVVFDLYGTLLDYGSLAASFDGGTVSSQAFVAAWRTKQLAYAMAATLMDRYRDFDELTGLAYSYVASVYGAPNDADARARAVGAWSYLPAFADVDATLERLRARGIAPAVLSNGSPGAIAASIAHAGLADRFDAVLSVAAVRRFKPHPDVYALVTQRFACAPEEIVFVSSNGWDATGGAEVGFRVVWCNRGNLPSETFGASPAHTIASLTALEDYLE